MTAGPKNNRTLCGYANVVHYQYGINNASNVPVRVSLFDTFPKIYSTFVSLVHHARTCCSDGSRIHRIVRYNGTHVKRYSKNRVNVKQSIISENIVLPIPTSGKFDMFYAIEIRGTTVT